MIEAIKGLIEKKDYTDGDLLEIAYNSIINKIKIGIKNIEIIGNKKLKKVITLGGGTQDKYLKKRLIEELEVEIETGYVEASVIGNAKCQYISKGIIDEKEWSTLKIDFK
jgi:sugar (pentulose or hexulose) kinase